MKKVILVDKSDNPVGSAEKLKAHQDGALHRAFSVFIFNKEGELLLQQRDTKKYHSGGLWSNTVCSHPEPGQDTLIAAEKRCIEEMGFTTMLREIGTFYYKSEYENGLCEHEFDHVLIGAYAGEIVPNPAEVMNYRWITLETLLIEIEHSPEIFTTWFQIIMKNEALVNKIWHA